jgi:hypothetical protein
VRTPTRHLRRRQFRRSLDALDFGHDTRRIHFDRDAQRTRDQPANTFDGGRDCCSVDGDADDRRDVQPRNKGVHGRRDLAGVQLRNNLGKLELAEKVSERGRDLLL